MRRSSLSSNEEIASASQKRWLRNDSFLGAAAFGLDLSPVAGEAAKDLIIAMDEILRCQERSSG